MYFLRANSPVLISTDYYSVKKEITQLKLTCYFQNQILQHSLQKKTKNNTQYCNIVRTNSHTHIDSHMQANVKVVKVIKRLESKYIFQKHWKREKPELEKKRSKQIHYLTIYLFIHALSVP